MKGIMSSMKKMNSLESCRSGMKTIDGADNNMVGILMERNLCDNQINIQTEKDSTNNNEKASSKNSKGFLQIQHALRQEKEKGKELERELQQDMDIRHILTIKMEKDADDEFKAQKTSSPMERTMFHIQRTLKGEREQKHVLERELWGMKHRLEMEKENTKKAEKDIELFATRNAVMKRELSHTHDALAQERERRAALERELQDMSKNLQKEQENRRNESNSEKEKSIMKSRKTIKAPRTGVAVLPTQFVRLQREKTNRMKAEKDAAILKINVKLQAIEIQIEDYPNKREGKELKKKREVEVALSSAEKLSIKKKIVQTQDALKHKIKQVTAMGRKARTSMYEKLQMQRKIEMNNLRRTIDSPLMTHVSIDQILLHTQVRFKTELEKRFETTASMKSIKRKLEYEFEAQ